MRTLTVSDVEGSLRDIFGVSLTLCARELPKLELPKTCPYCGGRFLGSKRELGSWVWVCLECDTLISRLNDTITI